MTLKLRKDDKQECEIDQSIQLLKREECEEYAEFHDLHCGNSYWTSDKILETFYSWKIFIKRDKVK